MTRSASQRPRSTLACCAMPRDLAFSDRVDRRSGGQWPLLAGLPAEDVEELLARARPRRFSPGEVVFHQHDPADTLHLIHRGRFAVQVPTPGERAILAILGPGETFGEVALVDEDARRSATVAALEPARTISIHRHDFERLRQSRPEVERIISALLAAQVRRLSDRLAEALYVAVEHRIRRRLLDLAQMYGDGSIPVRIPLTQQTLSDIAGTTRQAVNRVLSEDALAGVVARERGAIMVLDPAALALRAKL